MRFFQSKLMGLFWVGKIKIEYSYQIKVSLLGKLLVLKTSSRLVWLERHLKRFLTFESGLHFYFATVRYSLMWVAVSWTQSFDVHGHSLRFQMFQNNFFFYIFQVVKTAGLGGSFDTSMDPTGRYITQRIKSMGAYFATKSVLLTQWQCRRDFGRNIPDSKTIQRLVATFCDRKCGRCPQRPQWLTSFAGTLYGAPQKINTPSVTRNEHFENISFENPWWPETLCLTKFRSYWGKLITIKQNEKHFVKISVKGMKMTLAYSIWFSLATSLNFTWVGTSTSNICASGLKLNPMNLPIALLAKRKWLWKSKWQSCDAGNRPLNCTYADEVHSWRKKGAPPHCWDRSLELLDPYFPGDRLISHRTDFPWQRYSPDLNPCDYFLRRYLKEWIYDNNPQTSADLKDNLRRKIRHIPADMVGQVSDNFNVRVAAVILQGAWIEHFINYSGHTMHTT